VNKALFLDRDGTLIEYKPYLHRPDDVVLIPGTIDGLREAREAGYRLFLFTNQSGVGRGYFTLADVHRVHDRLLELLGLGQDLFEEICIAPEHPDEPSTYRKPSPRFIYEMVEKYHLHPPDCWMIGDSPSDWQAGLTAAIRVGAVSSGLTTPSILAEAERNSISIQPTLAALLRTLRIA
jgi:D-glycero-D-manno-heptose 1,7-bisphosphate phosphatase